MKTIHVTQADYEHLLRVLLDAQHFFVTFDLAQVTQEGTTRTFEAGGITNALERALNIVGWHAGDPMPRGMPFERLSPHPFGSDSPPPFGSGKKP